MARVSFPVTIHRQSALHKVNSGIGGNEILSYARPSAIATAVFLSSGWKEEQKPEGRRKSKFPGELTSVEKGGNVKLTDSGPALVMGECGVECGDLL